MNQLSWYNYKQYKFEYVLSLNFCVWKIFFLHDFDYFIWTNLETMEFTKALI